MARFAVQSLRGRAKSIVAFFAVFCLLVLAGQWCVRAVARAEHLVSASSYSASPVAVARARLAFLEARNSRLVSGRASGGVELALDALAQTDTEISSPDAHALIASIDAALKRWRDEPPLPEAYGVFAKALEEARAAEIERQFDLLADAVALEFAGGKESVRVEFAQLRSEALLWAVGAPAAAIILLLAMMRGAPMAPPWRRAPGVIILDADGRILQADDAAIAWFAESQTLARRNGDLFEALESAVLAFRNGDMKGESLIAGLESGDEIDFGEGRRVRIARHRTEDGGAIVLMSERNFSEAGMIGAAS